VFGLKVAPTAIPSAVVEPKTTLAEPPLSAAYAAPP